jgi:TonB family protein
VLPDGRVREDVQVLKTGGFRDFDERAVAALRQWRFSALSDGDAGGQWGTITFRFRLHG